MRSLNHTKVWRDGDGRAVIPQGEQETQQERHREHTQRTEDGDDQGDILRKTVERCDDRLRNRVFRAKSP